MSDGADFPSAPSWLGCDAGVIGEARAEHDQAIGLVHEPARDRRTTAAENAAAERMRVADEALALERGDDGRVHRFGERSNFVHVKPGAVADDDHRALRSAEQRESVVEVAMANRHP